MTAKRFEVGDRVALYVDCARLTGVLSMATNKGCNVKTDCGRNYPAHPKQLRRLKPKPPQAEKAREWWIEKSESYDGKVYDTDPRTWKAHGRTRLDLIKHVREVIPGEVSVSREKLAKAWDNSRCEILGAKMMDFDLFCKALGLPEVKS